MKAILISFLFLVSAAAQAGEKVEYKSGSTVLEGYLAQPDTKRLNQPAVLIVHDWMGLGDQTKQKADEMAKKGYVALAVDVYGKGVRPKDAKEAGELSGRYKGDVKLLRERMQAALKTVQSLPGVAADKVVVFGYCFGGTSALELGRSGAKVAGIATFHGGLGTPEPADAKNIKGKVLVMHGAVDPFVPAEEVATFQKAMNDAKIDYQFIAYSGAVHSFTNPKAGNDPKKGQAYNKSAADRSWLAFEQFLNETIPL